MLSLQNRRGHFKVPLYSWQNMIISVNHALNNTLKKKRSVLLFVKNTLARFGFRTRMMRTEEECFSKVKTTKED